MKNITREELSNILNDSPLTDSSKKSTAKALRYRNKTKLFSRLGIGTGTLMIFSGFSAFAQPLDTEFMFIQMLFGPILGIWFITTSLNALREIASAKALEELLIITANQSMDPTRYNAR